MINARMIMPMLVGLYASFAIVAMTVTPIVAAEETEDIPTNAQNTGYHESLVAALSQAGLVEPLRADGPFTVFAPTDQAFADAGIDLSSFNTDEENATLVDILTYHVVVGSVLSSDITDGMTASAFNGDELVFELSGNRVMVNDARVTQADVLASNGVIHVIDKVLMPPADPVGDICFNTVTQSIVPGANSDVCSAYMYVEDFEMGGQTYTGCYTTITHQLTDVSQETCAAFEWSPALDIPTTATATAIHTSLVAALTQADLVSALQADGPFTVFAPTDQAFIDAGIDLTALDTEEGKATLVDILTYHVYSGSVASTDVTDGLTVAMLNGDDASFTVSEGVVKVGDATVTLADVPASNGVIHVIDKVLMPPADIPEGCDYVIGVDSSGYAFDNTDLSIDVGQTVCWIWNDELMEHNVAEIENEGDIERLRGGKYSGVAMKSVDYRITFEEDSTFYYICEPHITMNMVGKVTVGTGIMEESESNVVEEEIDNSTPGFTAIVLAIGVISAVFVASRMDSE